MPFLGDMLVSWRVVFQPSNVNAIPVQGGPKNTYRHVSVEGGVMGPLYKCRFCFTSFTDLFLFAHLLIGVYVTPFCNCGFWGPHGYAECPIQQEMTESRRIPIQSG